MSSHLCVSVTFLASQFHGRADGMALEWPPSPLRLFQSMVAALGLSQRLQDARLALGWLERLPPPSIIAPVADAGGGFRLSVPNNSLDVVSRARARGNESLTGDANPATHRTMKTVKYLCFADSVTPTAHYVWELPQPDEPWISEHVRTLMRASRSIFALGWGVDMVAGHGRLISEKEVASLEGERWHASGDTGLVQLRVPVEGTLSALEDRHQLWLRRVSNGGTTLSPVAPLTRFKSVGYCRAVDPLSRAYAAFTCRDPETGDLRAFDTTRHASIVAAMARHATSVAAKRTGWSDDRISRFILGHGESRGSARHTSVGTARFAYIPVPSIEYRGVGSRWSVGDVRRLILTTYANGYDDEIEWAERTLAGQDLIDETDKSVKAILTPIAKGDDVLSRYTDRSAVWATVTPVVLPGYDDPRGYRRRLADIGTATEQVRLLTALDERVDALLRKAIVQAGLSDTLAKHAVLEWRIVGFWPGTHRADRYLVPKHLQRFPRLHVRIEWRDEQGRPTSVAGPLCIGGGRFIGIGLFAAL